MLRLQYIDEDTLLSILPYVIGYTVNIGQSMVLRSIACSTAYRMLYNFIV